MAIKAINTLGGDGTAVPAGYVGEEKTSGEVSVAMSGSTDVFVLVTSSGVTLTKGTWEIQARITSITAATYNRIRISTSNSSSTTGQITFDNHCYGPGSSIICSVTITPIRLNLTADTTYYLWGANSASPGTHFGILRAVRIA